MEDRNTSESASVKWNRWTPIGKGRLIADGDQGIGILLASQPVVLLNLFGVERRAPNLDFDERFPAVPSANNLNQAVGAEILWRKPSAAIELTGNFRVAGEASGGAAGITDDRSAKL